MNKNIDCASLKSNEIFFASCLNSIYYIFFPYSPFYLRPLGTNHLPTYGSLYK